MKATDAVRAIMARCGVSSGALAKRLERPQRLVTDRLAMENISVSKLNEMLAVMDYKIVLVPANEKKKDAWYVIE